MRPRQLVVLSIIPDYRKRTPLGGGKGVRRQLLRFRECHMMLLLVSPAGISRTDLGDSFPSRSNEGENRGKTVNLVSALAGVCEFLPLHRAALRWNGVLPRKQRVVATSIQMRESTN